MSHTSEENILSLKSSNIHPSIHPTGHLEMHLCDRLGRFIRRAEANEAEALRDHRAMGENPQGRRLKNPRNS